MWEEILKGVTIVLLPSAVKFFFGPLGGYAAKLNIITTMIGTAAGMMTSVVAFTFFGDWLRDKVINKIFKPKRKTAGQRRRIVVMWNKYGLAGVAALTPVLFTPIGGTIVAVSFRAPKSKIIIYMLVSAIVWSIIVTSVVYFIGRGALPDYAK
jgi:hypothetical protein